MSQPLYLKYRPQKLSELVGQELVVRILGNALKLKRLSHAYLFTGPRGCGKTSSARIFAKSINCELGPTLNPCGVCRNCQEITIGSSPDVIEMDAASHRGVEDAEQVIERSHLAPQGARHKVYIIDEVHMLSKEAFNAFLKTIEEPPPNVIFILATTEEHKVPATIISRCQRFSFRPAQQEALVAYLRSIADKESIKIDDQALKRIGLLSQGGLRDALSLLDQASILGLDEQTIDEGLILELWGGQSDQELGELTEALLAHDLDKVIAKIDQTLSQGIDPVRLLKNLIAYIVNFAQSELTGGANPDRLRAIILLADQLSKGEQNLRSATQLSLKLKSMLMAASLEKDPPAVSDLPIPSPKALGLKDKALSARTADVKPPSTPIAPVPVSPVSLPEETPPPPALSPSPKPKESGSQISAQDLLERIYESLPNAAKKASFKSADISILEMNTHEIVFGVGNKNYFKIVNDPKSLIMLEERIFSVLGAKMQARLQITTQTEQEPKSITLTGGMSQVTTPPVNIREGHSQVTAPKTGTHEEGLSIKPTHTLITHPPIQPGNHIDTSDETSDGVIDEADLKPPESPFTQSCRYILGGKPIQR